MFPVRNSQSASTNSKVQPNTAKVPKVKTSTTVVKSLASGLLAASPGQASISAYINFKFGMGQKANHGQSLWLGLRKLTRQMEMLELQAIKSNRPLSQSNCVKAVHQALQNLQGLLACLYDEEINHPSFRKELIEHLENIISWHPGIPQVWALAHKCLLPGEHIRHKNRLYDRRSCRYVVDRMFDAQLRARFVQASRAAQASPT